MPHRSKKMSSPRVTNNAVDVDSTTEAEEGKLFVGNLSFHCKEEDLVTLFSECGQVQRTFIHMTTRKYRQPMLYGHVVMGTREQAQAAAIQFNKIIYMGRPIRVTLWGERNDQPVVINQFQLHVSFVTKRVKDFVINEVWLRSIFERFGDIEDVKLSRHNVQDDQSRQGGYCFVFFTNQTSIQQALESMAHNTIDEVVFDCSISKRVNGNLASTSQDKDPNDDNCDQEA